MTLGDPAQDPAAQAPPANTSDPPAAGAAGAASNLQWQQADGTAITSAAVGDSVSASFDLAHDDNNQVTVNVLGADQTSQVGTATALERDDRSGFSAGWVVADGGDSFYFQVVVANPSAQPAPDPVLSPVLSVGAPEPVRDYYYAPDEKPVFDYTVTVTPEPPADSGQCLYHKGSETGDVGNTDDLVVQGTGKLHVDLSSYKASTDSPLFLEFVFKKSGHDDQTSSRAVALADPAPATIDVPSDAKPGDTVQLQVTGWNAIVYDTQGTGNAKAETDTSRISSDTQAAVKWKVGGNDVSDTGVQISYAIPADATGDQDVQAYLDVSSDFPAKATLALAAAAGADLTVTLIMDAAAAKAKGDQFTLASDDNAYTQTKTLESDVQDSDPSDGKVELHFTALDTTKSYSLEITEPGSDPYSVFQGVSYDQLATWSAPTAASDPPASDPPSGAPSATPTVTQLSPATSDPSGTTHVLITGTNLGQITSAVFGAKDPIDVAAWSDGGLPVTVVTAPGDSGPVPVVLKGDPSGDVQAGTFTFTPAGANLTLHLTIDVAAAQAKGDQFVLSSDDDTVTVTKTLESDHTDSDPNDGVVELSYTGLDTTKSYSLKIVAPDADPYFVFQGLSYSQLATWDGSSGSAPSP